MSLKPFLASTAVTSDVYTDFRWRMLFLCVCFDIEIKGVVDRIYSQAVCLGRNRCLEKVGIRHLQTIMTTVRCYNTYSTALLLCFFCVHVLQGAYTHVRASLKERACRVYTYALITMQTAATDWILYCAWYTHQHTHIPAYMCTTTCY